MLSFQTFLQSSVEFQEGGLSATTVSSLMILVLAVFQAWTGIKQIRVILKHRRAEKVSLPLCAYMSFYCLSLIVFGYSDDKGQVSIAMMSMGIIGVVFAIVMALIIYYQEDLPRWHYCLVLGCASFMPAMVFAPQRSIVLAVEVSVGGVFLTHQLYETYSGYKKKVLGDLEPTVAWVFLVSCVAWFIYALYTRNIVFIISNPIAGGLLGATLYYWYRTKKRVRGKRGHYIGANRP